MPCGPLFLKSGLCASLASRCGARLWVGTNSRKWTLTEFFAWQEKQHERYELVGGLPVRMISGTKAVHDTIVMNIIGELQNQLRGKTCRPFSGEHSVETLPGQIRRPDVGVDCGPLDPEAYKAAAARVIFEVLSPTTRDFDIFAKLEEYKTLHTRSRFA